MLKLVVLFLKKYLLMNNIADIGLYEQGTWFLYPQREASTHVV